MTSDSNIGSSLCTLPPFMCGNLRERIQAEQISINDLIKTRNYRKFQTIVKSSELPVPAHPLTITWNPNQLYFEIKQDAVVQKLCIWNTCSRTIYIHASKLWDEILYTGARWCCWPQTRFLLASGLTAELIIRAIPLEMSSVPYACARLQLAAAHKRDNYTWYFSVPIFVNFLNYVPNE